MISYHVFQFGNLLNIGLMVTMATIRQIHTLTQTQGKASWLEQIVFSEKKYFEETLALRLCKGISQIFSFHSTYLSMENCKVIAKLMIGDMILVTMTMMMMMFLQHVRNTPTVSGIAHCLSLQAFNNRELFCCAADFWRHPRLPGRADKKQTFRKRLRNTWRPRGKIKRNSLKLTVSKNSMKDDS